MSITGSAALQIPLESEASVARVPDLLRRHGVGLLVAVLLALVLVAPRWWVIASEPADGARVPISPYGAGAIGYDESLYASSIRQAYDGALPVSDPFLINHESSTPQRSAVPHTAIGLLGRATGDPFSALALVTTAAAIAALVGLYVLMYRLTGSRLAAAALVPVALVIIHVLNHAEGILPLRHKDILKPIVFVEPERELHAWTRFPAPILVLAPFFALVLTAPRAVERGERVWMAIAALSLAALIYGYVYYWTAAGVALAAWLVFLLARRERQMAGRLAMIGAAALLVALPEIIVLASSVISLSEDVRERVGLEAPGIDTSMAMTVLQRLLIGAPFLLALSYARGRHVFYAALFLAPLALVMLQGVIPQQWHYHTQVWGVFAIPAIVAGGTAIARMPAALALMRPLAAVLIVAGAGSFAYVAVLQARAVSETDSAFAVTDDEDGMLSWIRANVDDGATIVSPSITTNLLLASLTPASQYLAEGGFSTATDDELIERMLRAQAAYGYTEEEAFSRLDVLGQFAGFPVNEVKADTDGQRELLEDYLAFFTFSFQISDGGAFTERAESWRPRYRELLSTPDVLSAYPADYLYCGEREAFFRTEAAAPDTHVRWAYESGSVMLLEIVEAGEIGAFEFEGCPNS